ncbi:MAG: lysostaphin resistance A-like protein [Deltaproteobacteria bacterium]
MALLQTKPQPPVFRAEYNDRNFRRRERIIELTIFLFLIAPSMAFSFFLSSADANVSFTLTAVSSILRDLALVGLVIFFLWRNGEPLSLIGWDLRNAGTEFAVGLGLFIPFFVAIGLIQTLLQSLGLTVPQSTPQQLTISGASQVLLAVALVTVVAISEETIFRGYLIQRFSALMQNCWAAILVSSLIFCLGHGYEGSAGVVTVFLVGAFFGWVYNWRKSLIAPMVMHFLLDFVSIVLLPFVASR